VVSRQEISGDFLGGFNIDPCHVLIQYVLGHVVGRVCCWSALYLTGLAVHGSSGGIFLSPMG